LSTNLLSIYYVNFGKKEQVIEQAKARALLEGLSERVETLPDTGFSYYQEKQTRISKKISSTLSALSKKGVSEDLKNRLLSELERGEEEYLSLLNKIESQRIGKRVGSAEEIVTLSDVQQHMLDQKTAILEFFLGEKRSYAFFIAENTFRIEILPKREDIQDSLRGYLKLIASVPEREFRGELAAKRIYRDLIHPFENELSHIENLVIVPDGILFYLPFETLVQDRNGVISSPAYLIERCCISYAPSVSSLKFLLNKKPGNSRPKRLLAVGNPVYSTRPPSDRQFSYKEALREAYLENGFEFTPLVYSQKEVQQISRYFKKSTVDLYLGEKAKEEAFKKASLEDYQIIHFACHGFQDEKFPLRSALVLSLDDNGDEDGFLQGREIYHLRLNADLVVLSACQTARGRLENAEGVLGLPRLFFYAGAKSTISSLWKVNDRSTSELMRHFYGFLTEGKSKAQALRLAKLRLLKSKFDHPFYWAGFILSGDSRSIQ
jgi:CHAT domain-containing protein